jgi:hypothetical protein
VTQDPNLSKIELIAAALGPLCGQLVFVGGCAVGLLITDSAAAPVRVTFDVDLGPVQFLDESRRQAFGQAYPIASAPPTSRGIFLDHTRFLHAGTIARRGDALYLGLSRRSLCGQPSVFWIIRCQRHLEQATLDVDHSSCRGTQPIGLTVGRAET